MSKQEYTGTDSAPPSPKKAQEDALEAWRTAPTPTSGEGPRPEGPPSELETADPLAGGNAHAERTTKGTIDKADGTTAQRY